MNSPSIQKISPKDYNSAEKPYFFNESPLPWNLIRLGSNNKKFPKKNALKSCIVLCPGSTLADPAVQSMGNGHVWCTVRLKSKIVLRQLGVHQVNSHAWGSPSRKCMLGIHQANFSFKSGPMEASRLYYATVVSHTLTLYRPVPYRNWAREFFKAVNY